MTEATILLSNRNILCEYVNAFLEMLCYMYHVCKMTVLLTYLLFEVDLCCPVVISWV